jgi:hypothetical protein
VAEKADGVSALYEHMKANSLLSTEKECRAHVLWEKGGLARDKPGRRVVSASIQTGGAPPATAWLKELCRRAAPQRVETRELQLAARRHDEHSP